MKKKLAAVLAALMVLTVGTTVFAAPSTDTTDTTVTKAAESVGTVTSSTPGVENVKVTTVASADVVTDAGKVAATVAKSSNAKEEVLGVVEINATLPTGGADLVIAVSGVKAGDNIVVLHYSSAKNEWEKLTPKSVADGKIVVHFDSLSPVAIVRMSPVAAATTPATPTSPKTGTAFPVLAILAIVCAAGVVVCGRKVKFNA